MKLRAMVAIGLAGISLAFVVPASSAAAYPVTTCSTIAVSTTNPLPGESITVTGSNFTANAEIRLELRTQTFVLGTVTSSATGAFSKDVTLPDGVTGLHTIVAIGGSPSVPGCPANPSVAIEIQAAAGGAVNPPGTGGGGGGTAFTGVNVLIMLLAAAALIGAGVTFNRRGRRRSVYTGGH